jgi:hypothetical protein
MLKIARVEGSHFCDVTLASINFGAAPDLRIALSSREAKSSLASKMSVADSFGCR